MTEMRKLKIGDIEIPTCIVQGGMGVGISLAELVAAVIKAGGLGVLAAAGIGIRRKDYYTHYKKASLLGLVDEIKKVRQLIGADGPIAVNAMASLSNFKAVIRICDLMGVDIVFVGGGFPKDLPKLLLPGSKMKLVPIVSSGKAARILCKRWSERYNRLPDAIVVEGPLAGGHLGFMRPEELYLEENELENLVPSVIAEIASFEKEYKTTIPVIAAGGIYTGEDIKKYIDLGAAGVQMGTKFVTALESNVSDAFKQAYVDCQEEDIVVIKSPVGMPGRAIKNEFLARVEVGEKQPKKCPYQCISTCNIEKAPYCIFFALGNAYKGKMNSGFAFAGANAYRATKADKNKPVKEIIEILKREYEEAEKALAMG